MLVPVLASVILLLMPLHLEALHYTHRFRLNEEWVAAATSASTVVSLAVVGAASTVLVALGLNQATSTVDQARVFARGLLAVAVASAVGIVWLGSKLGSKPFVRMVYRPPIQPVADQAAGTAAQQVPEGVSKELNTIVQEPGSSVAEGPETDEEEGNTFQQDDQVELSGSPAFVDQDVDDESGGFPQAVQPVGRTIRSFDLHRSNCRTLVNRFRPTLGRTGVRLRLARPSKRGVLGDRPRHRYSVQSRIRCSGQGAICHSTVLMSPRV